MQTDVQTIWINAKPESVFAFATDQSKLPAWFPNTVSSTIVDGGPIKTGTKLSQIRRRGNREVRCDVRVIFHEPCTEHSIECSIMGASAAFAFIFEPLSNGTQVTLKGVVQGTGFARLLEGMIAAMCKKRNTETLENLKRRIEARVLAHASA